MPKIKLNEGPRNVSFSVNFCNSESKDPIIKLPVERLVVLIVTTTFQAQVKVCDSSFSSFLGLLIHQLNCIFGMA